MQDCCQHVSVQVLCFMFFKIFHSFGDGFFVADNEPGRIGFHFPFSICLLKGELDVEDMDALM